MSEDQKIYCIGIDPDTFNTGIALMSATVPERGRELEHVFVERVFNAQANGRQIRSRIVQLLDTIDEGMCEMTDWLGHSVIPDLIVVEWQGFRPGDPRPDDIVQLNGVAGIAAGIGRLVGKNVKMPLPVQWKGTVEKKKHQALVLKQLDLDPELDEVAGAAKLNKTNRDHVVTGIGLAHWGLEELAKQIRKERMLEG